MNLIEKLKKLLKKIEINLSEKQIQQLIDYVLLLDKWNKTYNLTSVRDPNEMLIKHILDSLMIAKYLKGTDFIDVGTGPGLPGIPLSIAFPEKNFLLCDSLGKRIIFLNHVKNTLNLKNVFPIQVRIENYNEKKFDGIISRAFASLEKMIQVCAHLANDSGKFYAMKGVFPENELKNLPDFIEINEIYHLDFNEIQAQRHLVILSKKNKK